MESSMQVVTNQNPEIIPVFKEWRIDLPFPEDILESVHLQNFANAVAAYNSALEASKAELAAAENEADETFEKLYEAWEVKLDSLWTSYKQAKLACKDILRTRMTRLGLSEGDIVCILRKGIEMGMNLTREASGPK